MSGGSLQFKMASSRKKLAIGDVVWARVPNRKNLWWPAQVADPTADQNPEVGSRSLPNHNLVVLYGVRKVFSLCSASRQCLARFDILTSIKCPSRLQWAWLPTSRIMDFDSGWPDLAKERGGKVSSLKSQAASFLFLCPYVV